jgi:hypothetical protein
MRPAFGAPEAKNFVPLFRNTADKVSIVHSETLVQTSTVQIVTKMSEIIANDITGQSVTIDVLYWLTRATLDGLVCIDSCTFNHDRLMFQVICRIGAGISIPPFAINFLTGYLSAAFDYNFGAVDELDNELAKSYTDLL